MENTVVDKAASKAVVKNILRACRGKGSEPLLLSDLLFLPLSEANLGGPLTFMTLREWCELPWFLNPPLDGLDETAALFGSWLSWHSQYALASFYLNDTFGSFTVRNLGGKAVNGVFMETDVRLVPCKSDLYVSFAFLANPFLSGALVCATCAVHDTKGAVYAQAVAWNTGSKRNTANHAVSALEKWAKSFCPNPARVFWVYSDAEEEAPEPIRPDFTSRLKVYIPIADVEAALSTPYEPPNRPPDPPEEKGVLIQLPKNGREKPEH